MFKLAIGTNLVHWMGDNDSWRQFWV